MYLQDLLGLKVSKQRNSFSESRIDFCRKHHEESREILKKGFYLLSVFVLVVLFLVFSQKLNVRSPLPSVSHKMVRYFCLFLTHFRYIRHAIQLRRPRDVCACRRVLKRNLDIRNHLFSKYIGLDTFSQLYLSNSVHIGRVTEPCIV